MYITITEGKASCDKDWDLFNGRCYFVSKVKKTWLAAKV